MAAATPATGRRKANPHPNDVRALAGLAIRDVLGSGKSLDEALARRLGRLSDPRDRGLARELAYGVLRFLPRLRALAGSLMERPLKERDLDLEALLWCGIYQIQYLRVPTHAAVAETAAACRSLGKPWAVGLVNAVLRALLRRQQEGAPEADASPEVHWCFPPWLLDRIRSAWPADWERVLEESNRRPPMVLRVNVLRGSRGDYSGRLAEAGLTGRPLAAAPQALVLDQPVDVERLPGFADGLVSVQDGGAQLAAPLLAVEEGQRVLDACAAPGGKTAHILELAGGRLDLTALDLEPARLERVTENLRRLDLSARVAAADVAAPGGDWTRSPYDRILLDVPCSATGVIRRHPDIKWLRRPSDPGRLAGLQGRILDGLWPLLRPGGILVYCTCSLLPEENQDQVQAFLARTADARELPIEADWGRVCAVGRQVLPGDEGMDGFYFARLLKSEGEGG